MKVRGALFSVLCASVLWMGSGCGDQGEAQAPTGEVEASVTYAQDIAPLVQRRCGGCHVEGGSAPFVLDSFETLAPLATSALASMESRQMPPWLPDPGCRSFEDERLMEPGELDLFKQWIEEGKAPGDLSAIRTVEAPQAVSFEATHSATIATPYTPNQGSPDDYRCFVLDLDFEEETFLTASTVIPDAGALVHHVLVYAIGPDQLEQVLEADEREAGEGYTCFGAPFPSSGTGGLVGSGGGLPTQVGAWVPGAAPQILPEKTAVRIEAGSKIVMQVHYNTISQAPVTDQSAFLMKLTQETPDYLVDTKPLIIRSLEIPAGEPEAVNRRTYTNHSEKTLQVGSVAAHMHLLGARYSATVERADGAQECLLEIPAWDFNWQQSYQLPQPLELAPGDSITLECVYNNSPANQPMVQGQQQEPRDVTWGEGTLDEMCMLYMSLIKPYAPVEQGEVCQGGASCAESCQAQGNSATACLLRCAEQLPCQACGLRGVVGCGSSCLGQVTALQQEGCLEDCFITSLALEGNLDRCLSSRCGQSYTALQACLDPILDSGSCDESLSACGLRP